MLTLVVEIRSGGFVHTYFLSAWMYICVLSLQVGTCVKVRRVIAMGGEEKGWVVKTKDHSLFEWNNHNGLQSILL